MSRYSVAAVLLSLIAGGAAGIVFENARQEGAAVRSVAETRPDAGPEAGAGDVALTSRAEVMNPEGGDEKEVAAGLSAARAGRRAGAARGRADRAGGAVSRPKSARDYVRPQRRAANDRGRGLAGHVAGGVKKTGTVIGKPFVKVGSLFHD